MDWRTLVSIMLLSCATCVVAANWAIVWGNVRNRRRGVPHSRSLVFLVSFILTVQADICSGTVRIWPAIIIVADPSNWVVVLGLGKCIAEKIAGHGSPDNPAANEPTLSRSNPSDGRGD